MVSLLLLCIKKALTKESLCAVTHTTEIPFVFGEFSSLSSPAQVILSHNTIDYWVSFVNGLNPNDGHGNKFRMSSSFEHRHSYTDEASRASLATIYSAFQGR